MDKAELIIAAGICVTIALIVLARQPAPTPEGFQLVAVSVEGPYIALTSGCSKLSIAASPWQLDSITSGTDYRPEMHELFSDALNGLDANVSMALVYSEAYGTYYARLMITKGWKVLELDAEPSDAVAMAVANGAPVYVSTELLKKNGKNVCESVGV